MFIKSLNFIQYYYRGKKKYFSKKTVNNVRAKIQTHLEAFSKKIKGNKFFEKNPEAIYKVYYYQACLLPTLILPVYQQKYF